jgi:transposase
VNSLSVTEQESIIGLLRLGWSERRIARETGHHRLTVRRCARRLQELDAGEAAADLEPSKAAGAPGDRDHLRSACAAHSAFIEAEIAKGRNAMAIYQDLVEHHGYAGSYDSVKRFARKGRKSDPKISCRFETLPGQEGQTDYGEGARTREPRTGKFRRPRLFVFTLGFSRDAYRKTVWHSSQQIWCELHEEAFAHFGGAPATLRIDNLREGVIAPDIYDPELNPLFAAMLKHYGVTALPCRPYAPDLKGKVESAVGYTQRTALHGREFENIEEQNAYLSRWNERWARTRIHGTTKRQVREMYEEERPALLPLPLTRFEYYKVTERRVHFDGHIEVAGAYYSAPPKYAGARVVVHVGRLWVRILDAQAQQLLREHAVTGKGQRRTVAADLPKQTPPQVEQLVARIARIGPHAGAFARAIENERGALALRTLFGILDLARRYDVEVLENACSLAVAAGTWRLRFLRIYLARHRPQSLTEQHRIIPDIESYSKHFATLTHESGVL